jgi:hypothetical protein
LSRGAGRTWGSRYKDGKDGVDVSPGKQIHTEPRPMRN